jgi:serine/threonine protein kinase
MNNIADEYEALEVIGKGSFGTVRKVRQRSDGVILVRKEIEYTSMNNNERNQIISELRILRELNHNHIVKYYRHDHLIESKSIHIYMEYCDGGDLARVISNFKKNREQVPEEFIWQVFVQTLLALHRCHYGIDAPKVNLFSSEQPEEPRIDSETVIIHRDIKPDNIFLLNSGKTIKVGDFGLAKMLTNQNDFAKTYVGTPYYMSPEVLMDNPYSPVCDIWSLGCVLYELCALQPPFQAKTHLHLQAKIKKGVISELPDVYSSQLRSMVRDCITVDPNERPTVYQLLNTLSIRFLRKELELRDANKTLQEFQKQLFTKNDELKKKEDYLARKENQIKKEIEDDYKLEMRDRLLKQEEFFRAEISKNQSYITRLESKIEELQLDFEVDYSSIQKRYKKLEDEYKEEFELRKRQMDLENKELRLGYQREFKLVVEQEVEKRIKELLANDINRKNSEPISRTYSNNSNYSTDSNKPRGPRDFDGMRTPLKIRNDEIIPNQQHKPSPQRNTASRKRITDELHKLTLEATRHTPEYEDVYLRGKHR